MLQIGDIDYLMVAEASRDIDKEARVVVYIVHGGIEAASTLDY